MKTRDQAVLTQDLGRNRGMGRQAGIIKNLVIKLKELYKMKTSHTMLGKNLVKNNVITNFIYD